MKYLLVTDIPAPWREKVYENVYKKYGNEFHVLYCKRNEKRRLWTFPLGTHPKTYLKSITIDIKGKKENFFNLGIIPFLLKNRPQVVICFSLNPTIYITLFISKLMKCKIAVFADTWLGRDRNVSWLQKIARMIYCNFFADAFIGASKQTFNWYKYYNKNIEIESFFQSSLCADNDYFLNYLKGKPINKRYDLMFSGRIVETKNPLFFVEVALKVKEKLGNCSVLIIGDGDKKLKNKMFAVLRENRIDYEFPGFIEHSKLPEYYSQSRIFLLPTSGDCWGVVINEALISGVPVITTNRTAAAGEVVLDGKNGYVLPMDSELWAEKIIGLLKNSNELESFSKCAREKVSRFNFVKAAQGIIDTIEYLNGK